MAWTILAGLPTVLFDANGNPYSGAVLKAYLPGTTTSTSLAIDSAGTSPQASITYNAEGKLEVSGNEILPVIDRTCKWAIFANTTDAAANTPVYMGPFDNVQQVSTTDATIVTVQSFGTVALARAATLTGFSSFQTLGYTTAGDGGSGLYRADVADGSSADDGFLVIVSADGIRFKLVISTSRIHVKLAGALGDDAANDLAAINKVDAYLLSIGGGDVDISNCICQIDGLFTLSAGNGLVGNYREDSVIKQIAAATGGVKQSGLNRCKDIRIEAPVSNTDTDSIGLDASGTSDSIAEQVRILYFGYGVKSTGLTWRQKYSQVRVDGITNTGFHFEEANSHLQIVLDSCYVSNTSTLGLTNKTSYFISGSLGTVMTDCTSDGGTTTSTKNLGLNVINSNLTLTQSHWEGYQSPVNFISGAEYDGIIRSSGSTVAINGIRFHSPQPDTASRAALIYAESTSRVTVSGFSMTSSAFVSFSSQHIAASNDSGENIIEIFGGDAAVVLAQSGTGAGVVKFNRTGLESKQSGAGAVGTHDGAANASVLTDTSQAWVVNSLIGDTIYNTTDSSSAVITANTETTITGVLSGGTADDWDVSDSYKTGLTENVNTIRTIVYISSYGDLIGFSGAHSDGQKVKVVHRTTGLTVKHSAAFRMITEADFVASANSVQLFDYSEEGAFWEETSRNPG